MEVGVEAEHLSLQPLKDPQVGLSKALAGIEISAPSHDVVLCKAVLHRNKTTARIGGPVWAVGTPACVAVLQMQSIFKYYKSR